jgi:hypothetical protein
LRLPQIETVSKSHALRIYQSCASSKRFWPEKCM